MCVCVCVFGGMTLTASLVDSNVGFITNLYSENVLWVQICDWLVYRVDVCDSVRHHLKKSVSYLIKKKMIHTITSIKPTLFPSFLSHA